MRRVTTFLCIMKITTAHFMRRLHTRCTFKVKAGCVGATNSLLVEAAALHPASYNESFLSMLSTNHHSPSLLLLCRFRFSPVVDTAALTGSGCGTAPPPLSKCFECSSIIVDSPFVLCQVYVTRTAGRSKRGGGWINIFCATSRTDCNCAFFTSAPVLLLKEMIAKATEGESTHNDTAVTMIACLLATIS